MAKNKDNNSGNMRTGGNSADMTNTQNPSATNRNPGQNQNQSAGNKKNQGAQNTAQNTK